MGIRGWIRIVLPGLLVAATGVGAGDLATAAFAGGQLGVAILWAVIVGAALKFVLTEGLARYQLVTGQTLLEGCSHHLGLPFQVLFTIYFFCWSFFVGAALMAACGVTAHALLPWFDDPARAKLWLGLAHSAVGLVLVWVGGYKLFERIMGVCIALMFVTVIVTAVRLLPDAGGVMRGLVWPAIPRFGEEGLGWTIALLGGVGGTLTVLVYGYWIREAGRAGARDITVCRIDLATGYAATALFGLAMVVIGSTVVVEGSGAGLVVSLGQRLQATLGPVAGALFLVGAWGAVFSSLLGVWQSVPYVFADFAAHVRGHAGMPVDTRSRWYRGYLLVLATVPALGLVVDFRTMQQYYAVFGACFMPFLAGVLLYLNGPWGPLPKARQNRLATSVLLVASLGVFLLALVYEARQRFGG
jgi:Mn2+/Fe2+ NRAMP family transporter